MAFYLITLALAVVESKTKHEQELTQKQAAINGTNKKNRMIFSPSFLRGLRTKYIARLLILLLKEINLGGLSK